MPTILNRSALTGNHTIFSENYLLDMLATLKQYNERNSDYLLQLKSCGHVGWKIQKVSPGLLRLEAPEKVL